MLPAGTWRRGGYGFNGIAQGIVREHKINDGSLLASRSPAIFLALDPATGMRPMQSQNKRLTSRQIDCALKMNIPVRAATPKCGSRRSTNGYHELSCAVVCRIPVPTTCNVRQSVEALCKGRSQRRKNGERSFFIFIIFGFLASWHLSQVIIFFFDNYSH